VEKRVTLAVRVTPRARQTAIVGWREDGVLLVRVNAPPLDGAANQAVQELLADALGVRKSAVALVGGQTAREKRFEIEGITEEQARERLLTAP
jgi:hypothetical protein